ncbi:MAG TPA: hypothetical protein VFU59_00220, partial [Candidatus Eisenbacteria bacterium]|nr:hypothetical protein [Candidatus Eisenbacteria bacterium]
MPAASVPRTLAFAAFLLAAVAGAPALFPGRAVAQDEFLLNDDRLSRNQWEPSVARGATGTLVVAWQDGRNGVGTFEDYDIYALTIRNAFAVGTTLNRRLNDDPPGQVQSSPDIAGSPAGTYFCVWVDSRLGNRDIFGVTLDSLGIPITPNLRVSDDIGTEEQFAPRVISLGSDRYFVVWGDGRDGKGEIFASYRTASGATIGGNLRISQDPVVGASVQSDPSCAALPDGTTLVVWVDGRNSTGVPTSYDIYGQRLDASGAALGGNFQISDGIGPHNASGPTVSATATGFIVAWLDRRRTGDQGDVWAQRIAVDGTPVGGNVMLNDDTIGIDQRSVRSCDAPGGALVFWEDLRGGLGLDPNVEGAFVPESVGPTGPNFRVNATTGGRQGNPGCIWDGFEAAIVVWEDLRRGSSDIFALPVRVDGTRRGADTQLNDDAASFDQRRARLGKGRGRYFATWIDLRGIGNDLYGQWVTAAGARDGPNQILWDDNFTERPVEASSAVADAGPALAAVQVTRSSDAGDIRGVLLPSQGSGIASAFWISDQIPSSQALPRVAGADAGFGVAWLDSREGTVRLYAQRLGLDGARVGANHRVMASEPADPIFDFDLVAAPDAGYWLLYAEGATADQRLWLLRLDDDLVEAGAPIPIAPAIPGKKESPGIDVSDGGRMEIVWLGDGATGEGQVYHAAFAPNGADATPLGAPLELVTEQGANVAQSSPWISVDGSLSVVSWASRPTGDWSVWIQRIENGVTPDGPALHVDQDLLNADQLEPTVGVDGAGNVLTIWTDGRSTSSGTDVLGRVIRFTTTAADPPPDEPPPAPDPAPPAAFRVGRARPNPFLAGLGVPLDVPAALAGGVRVAVYNALGVPVRVLHDGPMPAASSVVAWDGRDRAGRSVPSGV